MNTKAVQKLIDADRKRTQPVNPRLEQDQEFVTRSLARQRARTYHLVVVHFRQRYGDAWKEKMESYQ